MKDKKVLFVSSEVMPYSPENEISKMSFETPRMVNSNGGQIRIFMPRFGNINERRHQLHEVIRLSGMNIVINDIDVPLIIKVASIPKERIQVYFIDNDEYFKRKATFSDENGELFPDNDERCIFFAKGVVETVKKLNWLPDIIHIHGWLASLLPLYLRTYYKDEPIFQESKIITSVFNKDFEGNLDSTLISKVNFDGISSRASDALKEPNYFNLMKIAAKNSDGVIIVGDDMSEDFSTFLKGLKKPILYNSDQETFQESYRDFYLRILKK
ncbi:glycogen/starch synthase [Capnocytophaga cynodegmi]|uniref:glycogen/starch synthase n=1 Tax=Capnocytophaga cynodegmi TaxID=28189 RepID=UPI001ACDE24C|nr:glycogen/starch synthase [Capnocytophaga cynodegmi]GIM53657.1 glycogen synthase [Capnocytophaga cynodegmi]